MKNFLNFAVALSGLLLTSVAFAQDGASSDTGLWAIAAGLAVAIGATGAATAQGRAATAALEGIARNPGAKDAMFQPLILSLVFMEFQALLSFVIAILWTTK